MCAISSWYYVVLESRIERAGYLWALLGVLITLGGCKLAVRKARKMSDVDFVSEGSFAPTAAADVASIPGRVES